MLRLALAVLIFGAGAAQAQGLDCDNAMTQQAMNRCAALELEAADKDLNAAYAEARGAMRDLDTDLPPGLSGAELALRDAQRAWISYRDKACAAEGFLMRGGSAEPLLVLGCRLRLTEQRAEDLWSLAEGPEG
ncbi:lysozyme inhibitor LprI family protein [Pseudotabrizicola algicola]|nr:lysozyme inhibitor LprI family protein [Pseudotabrizicola algicola]